jgi:uncharacterized protein YabN with tetrapyrrole methylase and pyrophosphatase domain
MSRLDGDYAETEEIEATGGVANARASLVVVGVGIQWGGQTTQAALRAIQRADRVLFAVADPWAARWIRRLSPHAESMQYPQDGRPRRQIYEGMVARILEELRAGHRVCAVFYGSPTLLAQAAHDSVRRARAEGICARMLPGVSSLDCLFADLEIDPGGAGCHVCEASLFLARRYGVEPRAHTVLWQIAMIDNAGVFHAENRALVRAGLARLEERLSALLPADHEVVVYEASTHPLAAPRADRVALSRLRDITVNAVSTLYIPPVDR